MPTLDRPVSWRRSDAKPPRAPELTAEESAHLKAAIRFLRIRSGGFGPLASLLKVKPDTLRNLASGRGRPGAALALRAARAAGVTVEDVLSGAFPPAGACPHCGRS